MRRFLLTAIFVFTFCVNAFAAIRVSDSSNASYDGNLSTASGFYNAEAWNMGMFSTTTLGLNSTRTIAVTFAVAGNCQGLIINFGYNTTLTPTAVDRDVTVTLQEYITSVWTTIATKTLTYNEITNSSIYCEGWWTVPFTGGTFPVAVDTDISTYRFQIIQSGGTKGTWLLRTSDATNPFYVTWCDNKGSFSSTNDAIVVKDAVTIDATCNFKGVLGTGDTTRSVAVIVCRSTDPTPTNVSLFKIMTPAAAYTMTLDGLCVLGTHSGFRAGTSTVPIPADKPFTITFDASPTLGSVLMSKFCTPLQSTAGAVGSMVHRSSLFLFGAIPAVERTTLDGDVAVGAAELTVDDDMTWVANDTFVVGKCDGISTTFDRTSYTVTSVPSAKHIHFSPVLATIKRLDGGMVFRTNGYGIILQSDVFATEVSIVLPMASNLTVSGVQIKSVRFYNYYSNDTPAVTFEDTANSSQQLFSHCSYHPSITTTSLGPMFTGVIPEKGVLISYCNSVSHPFGGMYRTSTPEQTGGTFTLDNCWIYATAAGASGGSFAGNIKFIATNNKFESHGSSTYGSLMFSGTDCDVSHNTFYGGPVGVDLYTVTRGVFHSNTYNRLGVAIRNYGYGGGTQGTVFSGETFGDVTANTIDIGFQIGANTNIAVLSPLTAVNVDTSGINTGISGTIPGSRLYITNYGPLTNDDRNWYTYGYINRVGDGIGDTTVRTAGTGKFALRFQPTDSTNKLTWIQYVPTGNIQNKTMNVNVWVGVKNTAYWAGTYTMPTLRVNYDNGTEITAVHDKSKTIDVEGAINPANGFVQLNVSFTPTTTYGQISVQLEGATDATTTNAYFYVDDMNVAYPAGVSIDLGGMDIFANALPVTPAIATMPSLAGVWDEATSAHTTSGSFGALAIKTEVKADDAAALKGVN